MKRSSRWSQIAFLGIASLFAVAALAQGNAERARRWEFTLQLSDVDSQTVDFDGGSHARTDNSVGFGIGFAYNFNNHLNLGGTLNWNSIDYEATIQPDVGTGGGTVTGRGSLDTTTFHINLTYNILSGPVTPFITGGLGATYIDTNIPNGPPVEGCWWYPWWGYYCGSVVPTRDDTYFSYSAGAGVRWDISRAIFLKGAVNSLWIDYGHGASYDGFVVYSLDVGFKF